MEITNTNIDVLVVGAGLSGCTIAERFAEVLGLNVLLVDRRNHIAGNCYDEFCEAGTFIHKYGPHCFRTNNNELVSYLSAFTEWIPGDYIVQSLYKGELYPFPINLDTLEKFFNLSLTKETAEKLLMAERIIFDHPANSEEYVLSKLGKKLYEAFYLNYTLKQWSKHPRELDSSVCGRIPVKLNRDKRYVEHNFQMMPAKGYTEMVKKMISHPRIKLNLNTDYKDVKINNNTIVVYTGAIDEYFDYCFGRLPWRSLKFEYKHFEKELVQTCLQINYPNDFDYTRSVEVKHITQLKHPNTTVVYEYPTEIGEPYYPIPALENRLLYKQYKSLAEKETQNNNVFFTGRLAEYAYLNMDEVIENALSLFEKIKGAQKGF